MSAKAKEDVKLFLENEKAVSKASDQKLDDEKVVEEKMETYRALWNKRDASLKGKKWDTSRVYYHHNRSELVMSCDNLGPQSLCSPMEWKKEMLL